MNKLTRKIFVRCISIVISATMVFLSACDMIGGNSFKYTYVNYDEKEKDLVMTIGAYWCPPAKDEYYKSIEDCGINLIFLDQKLGDKPTGENWLKALEYCDKYNIKAILGKGLLKIDGQESVDNHIDQYLTDEVDYSAYPAFSGICMKDEPRYLQLPYFVSEPERIYAKYPDASVHINLAADYSTSLTSGQDITYKDYVEYTAKNILCNVKEKDRVLSLDHYPMQRNNSMRDTFLWTIELSTDLAKQYDCKTAYYLQSTYQGSLATDLREINYDTLSLQAYSYLAYGNSYLIHFLYYLSGYQDNQILLNGMGQKTVMWYIASQLNHELLNFDHVLMQFEHKDTMPVYGKDNEYKNNNNLNAIRQTENLTGIESVESSVDVLLSSFKDSKDNNGYMLVNFNDKDTETVVGALNAECDIKFPNGCNGATFYYHGEKVVVKRGDSDISIKDFGARFSFDGTTLKVKNLEAGQGIFIIPTK